MFTSPIRTGSWYDYSENSHLGYKVTYANREAAFLIAFIAVFNGFVGTMIWNIIGAIIFRVRSRKNKLHDGLYYQTQALLRNTTEPLTFARDSIWSGWKWKKIVPGATLRSVPLALLAISTFLISSAVGVFSSRIATSSNAVLLDGGLCGFVDVSESATPAQHSNLTFSVQAQTTRQMQLSSTYGVACYKNPFRLSGSITPADANCQYYARPEVNVQSSLTTTCPFEDPTACASPEAVVLDTGYLDSNRDLGMNQAPENRVSFRRVQTCSPLSLDGFFNNSLTMIDMPNSPSYPAWLYNYGTNNYDFGAGSNLPNTTFAYTEASYNASDVAFSIQAVSTVAGYLTSNTTDTSPVPFFVPSPRLSTNPKVPLTLLFLSNRVHFLGKPVTDPWYNASDILDPETKTYYSKLPGRVLGCLEQAQICNPLNNQCTDLDSWWSHSTTNTSTTFLGPLSMTPLQQTTSLKILSAISKSTVYDLFQAIGSNALNSQNLAVRDPGSGNKFHSTGLQDDQWHWNTAGWFAAVNAMTQRLIVDGVTGGPWARTLLQPNTTLYKEGTTDYKLCNSQRVKSTEYQSFSVVGMVINFTLGGIFIIISMMLSFVLPNIKKRSPNFADRSWQSLGLLQMQRMAYEKRKMGMGMETAMATEPQPGDWKGDDAIVPVTRGEMRFLLPMVGDHHPSGGSSNMNVSDRKYTEDTGMDALLLRTVPSSVGRRSASVEEFHGNGSKGGYGAAGVDNAYKGPGQDIEEGIEDETSMSPIWRRYSPQLEDGGSKKEIGRFSFERQPGF